MQFHRKCTRYAGKNFHLKFKFWMFFYEPAMGQWVNRLISVPYISLRSRWVNPHTLSFVLPHQYAMHYWVLITAKLNRYTKDWLLFIKRIIFLHRECNICQLNWVKYSYSFIYYEPENIFLSYNECYASYAYQRQKHYWLIIWYIATDVMIVSHTN